MKRQKNSTSFDAEHIETAAGEAAAVAAQGAPPEPAGGEVADVADMEEHVWEVQYDAEGAWRQLYPRRRRRERRRPGAAARAVNACTRGAQGGCELEGWWGPAGVAATVMNERR